MRKLVLSSASAMAIMLATGAGAGAADVLLPGSAEILPAGAFDWSGSYIGVHGGLGWAGFKSGTDGTENHITGGVAGLHLGMNWQPNSLVFGLEGDVSGANIFAAGSTRVTHVDALASIRGRLGFAFDRVLVYATGGGAYVHGLIGSSSAASQANISNFRPVVGAGVEFAAIEDLTLRAEVLGYLGTNKYDISGSTWELNDIWVTRLGLTYNFSDSRLKRDISLLSRLANGLGLYRYRYLWSKQVYVGVMAQEVAKIMPDAVVRGPDGFLRVNYRRLGLRLMTWDEWSAQAT